MNVVLLPKTPAEIAGAIEALSATHVDTSREETLRQAFERLFRWEGEEVRARLFANDLETRGILVIGDSGSGKTELVSHFLETQAAFRGGAGVEQAGYLHVTVPSPATLKSVGLEILKALGYTQVSERRERWAIWELVKHRLTLLGINVLWVDEAHDLYASGSVREQEDLLKTLKSLMQGEHAVVLILSGTKRVADLMKVDQQVGRRFTKIELPPITFTQDGEALMALISAYAERVGLRATPTDDLVQCLIHAAHDQFGLAIEIVIGAIEMALRNGRSEVGQEDFIEYWGMQEGCSIEANVFHTNLFADPHNEPDLKAETKPKGKKRR